MSTCRVCKKSIEKNTLKYTIKNINVHLSCFKCVECDNLLSHGDHFVIDREDRFVCSSHFQNQKYLKNNLKSDDEQINSSSPSLNNLLADSTSLNSITYSIEQPASHLDHHLTNHLDQFNENSISNSMNLIDYLNYDDDNHLQSTNDDFYLKDCLNKNNLPASNLIDNYWTQVNSSSLNENCLNTQFIQRKVRSKRKKDDGFKNTTTDSGMYFKERDSIRIMSIFNKFYYITIVMLNKY